MKAMVEAKVEAKAEAKAKVEAKAVEAMARPRSKSNHILEMTKLLGRGGEVVHTGFLSRAPNMMII